MEQEDTLCDEVETVQYTVSACGECEAAATAITRCG